MHRVTHRAARFVRGSRHARGTVDNPTSSLGFYPQASTYPGRFSVQTIGATSLRHPHKVVLDLINRMAAVSIFHSTFTQRLIFAAKADRLKPVVSTL